ncbi:hypothetical protein [Vibrio neptunius]|uniref:hypothetical protein n=1 Tax=Vibrio neptunius TaxID=170651 RepID=UPI001F0A5D75|nr:hypothetical protein [Vibrio neptunius]
MTLYHVSDEKSLTWLNNIAPVAHETPEYPIDQIMNAKFDGSRPHFAASRAKASSAFLSILSILSL